MPWIRVSAVVTALALASGGAHTQTPHEQTVVFVCEHGAAKSVVAAAHFNKLARERGLGFRAISRGTDPEPAVPARVREGLSSDGAPVEDGFAPERVQARDTAGAARVVTFDVKLPIDVPAATLRNWSDVPAFSDGYDAARNDIRARVEALLQELAGSRRVPSDENRQVSVFAVSGMV